jgi:hypothetical protein
MLSASAEFPSGPAFRGGQGPGCEMEGRGGTCTHSTPEAALILVIALLSFKGCGLKLRQLTARETHGFMQEHLGNQEHHGAGTELSAVRPETYSCTSRFCCSRKLVVV